MSRRALLAILALAVFVTAAIPAVAKTKARTSSVPVVKKVRPLKVKIGSRLSIYGSGFLPGHNKNTVVFMGPGKRVVWVKAAGASRKKLSVVLPAKLTVLLDNNKGVLQPTRMLIRVIAKKSGKRFTKRSISPIVLPSDIGGGNGSGGNGSTGCVPKSNDTTTDTDGDMVTDAVELVLGTDPCRADTDGDGIPDGYEYQSALDLNRNANSSTIPWPFPGKKPYPNPLDPTDGDTDYDGDSLTMREEYTASFAWLITGVDPQHFLHTFIPFKPNPNPQNNVMVVAYSDGDQTTNPTAQGNLIGNPSGPAAPCSPGQTPSTQSGVDVNGNGTTGDAGDVLSFQDADGDQVFTDSTTDVLGWMNEANHQLDCYLSDDEKDVDGDGLSNYTEAHGPLMGQEWWTKLVKEDGTFPIDYAGTNWLDRDSDGDGILDGSDDQDHDGYSNIEESMPITDPSLTPSQSFWRFPVDGGVTEAAHWPNVNAFNPCLPNLASPACPRHPAGGTYAPYKLGSPDATYNSWPRP